ncbi:MAG TPA: hypothetical protein VNO81_04260 [Candidatus Nitrosotenuis sp.]|jgi:hypothetical protein|nr:hypothetical protein [Candidatus Nitrosotenuis sp.]
MIQDSIRVTPAYRPGEGHGHGQRLSPSEQGELLMDQSLARVATFQEPPTLASLLYGESGFLM